MGSIDYSYKVNEFINFFYNSDLVEYDYAINIEKCCIDSKKIYVIYDADISLLKSISTYYISLIKNLEQDYLCIFTSGCSSLKYEEIIFGYMQGNTYINKVLGFSMNVLQDWIVNEKFKNIGERTIEEILKKQGSLTIEGMVNMSMEEALSDSQEKEELSSIYISLFSNYTNIE